jgi:hypothetical protein
MDKLKRAGQTVSKFLTLEGTVCMHLQGSWPLRPNLELKTLPKQLLGYLPLDIALLIYTQNQELGLA